MIRVWPRSLDVASRYPPPLGVLPKAVYNLWVAVAFMWGWAAPAALVILLLLLPAPGSGRSNRTTSRRGTLLLTPSSPTQALR